MMRCAIAILLVITFAQSAPGQQHPNVAKGFEADKVYQFSGIDNVNLFNGNLSLTIPIGQEYAGAGTLRYRFVLSYNSKAWDYETTSYICATGQSNCDPFWGGQQYIKAVPSRRSNAGMGWLLSMGRLMAPDDPLFDMSHWTYESPDGADHAFPMQEGDTVAYSEDGSFLRWREVNSTEFKVDFPDGMVHTFQRPSGSELSPQLTKISDPFGNYLAIDCTPTLCTFEEHTATATVVRTHSISFASHATAIAGYDYDNYDLVVDEVDLAAFGGGRALYSFGYTDDTIPYGCHGEQRPPQTPDSTIPRLKNVTLPDGSRWEFEYYSDPGSTNCSSLKKFVLPTKGFTEFTYQPWSMPTEGCRAFEVYDMASTWSPYSTVEGVATKTISPGDGTQQTYSYTQAARIQSQPNYQCPYRNLLGGISHSATPKFQESLVTVTNPDGTRSEHYFSILPHATANYGTGFDKSEYGLPFTRDKGTDPNNKCDHNLYGSSLCLSTKLFDSAGALKRSTYVRYEGEDRSLPDEAQHRREVEGRTVFHDDPITGPADSSVANKHYVHVSRSEYDGLGHYRKTVTSDSWSGTSRTERTTYNPTKPAIIVDPIEWTSDPAAEANRPGQSAEWLLTLFDERTIAEKDVVFKSEYWFDSTTGFLNRTRQLKNTDGSRGSQDLIAVFTPYVTGDDRGSVELEAYYGGDAQEVETGSLSSLTLPEAAEYRLEHDYSYGTRDYSAYIDSTGAEVLRVLEAEIDPSTGLVLSTKDPADVETTYGYDAMSRIASLTSTGRARTDYSYQKAGTPGYPLATVLVDIDSSDDLNDSQLKIQYDGLGRVKYETRQMPAAQTATRETVYNNMGRRSRVSEWETTPVSFTDFFYDFQGRPTRVVSPDQQEVTSAYVGVRQQTTTKSIFMGDDVEEDDDTPVTTTETYDAQGRLIKVVEKSGPTSAQQTVGADVTTHYTYDAADRLRSVKMVGQTVAQLRVFDYDGRGFLRWESHPESGTTAYTFDARGHVLDRRVGAADSPFDLDYTYDAAERLTQIESRDPDEPTSLRPLKVFEYGTENLGTDLRNGKLVLAARYNYALYDDRVYKIVNTYDYDDVAGRLHGRKQQINLAYDLGGGGEYLQLLKELDMSVERNDLDLVSSIRYPMCTYCGGPPRNPFRDTEYKYERGLLSRVEEVFGPTNDRETLELIGNADNPIVYWPNGMWKSVFHANGIVDTQTVGSMPRPTALSFATYDRCVSPSFLSQPAGGTGATTLSVSVAGTGPFEYQWWSYATGDPGGEVGTTASITVNPTVQTSYYVIVANPCGTVESHTAVVTPTGCVAPTTGAIKAVLQPNGSWILRPDPKVRPGATYSWKRLPQNTVVGTQETLAVGLLSATTTYSLTITDSCGVSATSSVTIQVPLPAPTGLVAQWNGSNGIALSWSAVSGATSYSIERRSGTTWELLPPLSPPNATTYLDTTIQQGRTYAYRVSAAASGTGSNPGNADVATTKSYTVVQPGDTITTAIFNDMLDAVNKVRGAAGLPTVGWDNILSPSDPLPSPGEVITARQILACRARMSEALQVVGAIPGTYSDPDPQLRIIRAVHVNEIRDQTK